MVDESPEASVLTDGEAEGGAIDVVPAVTPPTKLVPWFPADSSITATPLRTGGAALLSLEEGDPVSSGTPDSG